MSTTRLVPPMLPPLQLMPQLFPLPLLLQLFQWRLRGFPATCGNMVSENSCSWTNCAMTLLKCNWGTQWRCAPRIYSWMADTLHLVHVVSSLGIQKL
ncbi:hypothetical protein SUGI_0762420 [Cryptomeria japonica]|nr:hypothetical protein SUGI_0762420 [Cryptomeria japonica]